HGPMSSTRVKICGLTAPEHAEAALAAGAEFVGLVFAEHSRRHVTVERARTITGALPARTAPPAEVLPLDGGLWCASCSSALHALIARGGPLVVGVSADQPVSLMNSIAESTDLDLIQLSGNEPWEVALQLRRPAIKTLRAGAGASAEALLAAVETGTASLCLLDGDVPGRDGGTGGGGGRGVAAGGAGAATAMLLERGEARARPG